MTLNDQIEESKAKEDMRIYGTGVVRVHPLTRALTHMPIAELIIYSAPKAEK